MISPARLEKDLVSPASLRMLKRVMKRFLRRNMSEVKLFLETPSHADHYNSMAAKLQLLKAAAKVEIMIVLGDGHVAFDSRKSNNSHANFKAQLIDENHHSRPEVLRAVLQGEAYAHRESSTTETKTLYLAHRLGESIEHLLGTIRISVTA